MGEKKQNIGAPTATLLSADGRYLHPHELEKVQEGIADAVLRTTKTRPMPSGVFTKKELQDRLDAAVSIWNYCYGEARWSWRRTLDHLEWFLTKVIDGAREYDALSDVVKDIETERSVAWGREKLREIEAERRLTALASVDVGDTVGEELENQPIFTVDEIVEDQEG